MKDELDTPLDQPTASNALQPPVTAGAEVGKERDLDNYQSALKATGILGFTQVIRIAIRLVGTKVVALLLGPAGIGIIGLLRGTQTLASDVVNAGLSLSAVREIAAARGQDDRRAIEEVVITLRRLIWSTGLIGTIAVFVFARELSVWTFGDASYTYAFRVVSPAVLFTQLTAGYYVLLTGYRLFGLLAYVTIGGVIAGLVVSLPMYFWLGAEGIPYALLLMSIPPFFLAYYYSRIVGIERGVRVDWPTMWQRAKPMLKLGIATQVSLLIFSFSLLQIKILVQNQLGLEAIGFFQAGWGISTTYMVLVFRSMGSDYLPRLSKVVGENDKPKLVRLVNEQLHLVLLIATPLLGIAIVGAPWMVPILYSSEFGPAIPQIQWFALGTILKVIVWPLSFVLLATESSKWFLFTEIIGTAGIWVGTILFLPSYGLDGIGLAFILTYAVYCLTVYPVVRRLISFRFDRLSVILSVVSVVFLGIVFWMMFMYGDELAVVIFAIVMVVVVTVGFGWRADKLVNLRGMVRKKLFKK